MSIENEFEGNISIIIFIIIFIIFINTMMIISTTIFVIITIIGIEFSGTRAVGGVFGFSRGYGL